MAARSLRIAWLGPGPATGGGVAGVATELLGGLARRGHRIDCFLPGRERPLPEELKAEPNIEFVWGTNTWQWDRWYSRARIAAFLSGLCTRALALLRLRRELAARHAREPYDVIYQFSTIENLGVPPRLAREVPLVVHPETHAAGELRSLIAERRLSWRCQPPYVFAVVTSVLALRALVQRLRIRHASLLIGISAVFRDHIVRDYRFPASATAVVPNPVRVDRFAVSARGLGEPATVLVLGRIAVRKGVEDVVALAHELLRRRAPVRIRVVGGPSLWTDYTKLLEDLPENAEYVGPLESSLVPAELAATDVLLQPSKYEPFALTVGEALAAGVPVVGTSEVGAVERVDREVASVVAPGDVAAMADAVEATIARLRADAPAVRARARAEAERLFAPEVVVSEVEEALERLLGAAPRQRPGDVTAARAAT
jgi:glycosyltransferase involved in cell wall biosynthesis